MGLIDEISTKTIHIKEKNRGNVFIYLPTGHYEVAPCSFDHIRNDKCPNDSRRIMPFVASVSSFLVPRRKVRFGEFVDSMSVAALDIF